MYEKKVIQTIQDSLLASLSPVALVFAVRKVQGDLEDVHLPCIGAGAQPEKLGETDRVGLLSTEFKKSIKKEGLLARTSFERILSSISRR